ncbi:MAG TPA: hypothetical protein DEH78_01040 [Solibacterales bacterium]|nr:hypothetical protein [Bryobacterales bacterium]
MCRRDILHDLVDRVPDRQVAFVQALLALVCESGLSLGPSKATPASSTNAAVEAALAAALLYDDSRR